VVINFTDNTKIVFSVFFYFMINGQSVEFVQEFGYLGHVSSRKMLDDFDIKREISNMFVRTDMLTQRFKRCSVDV